MSLTDYDSFAVDCKLNCIMVRNNIWNCFLFTVLVDICFVS